MKYLFFIITLFATSTFALEIQNIRVIPDDINAGDNARVMFKLNTPATLSVEIKDFNGHSVTSLVNNAIYPAGQFSVLWKTPKNIGAGYYIPVITAVNRQTGKKVTERLKAKTAKMISVPFNISDLPGAGKKISYSLDKPGLVSIRVGINNGPMYKIISNWVLTQPGTYSVNWDGWDNSHVLKVDQLANYLIDVRYIPVEIDALHIKNNLKTKTVEQITAPELLKQIHAFIPEFSALVVNKNPDDKNLTLDIQVDQKTLDELGDIPFEYVLYIDGERYGEIENTSSPYKWEISTENITKGNHIFTLMVCTSIEQINSKSFKVTL